MMVRCSAYGVKALTLVNLIMSVTIGTIVLQRASLLHLAITTIPEEIRTLAHPMGLVWAQCFVSDENRWSNITGEQMSVV